MMSYMVLICLTAQASATLHALSHFPMSALAPAPLNICWIIGICFVVPLSFDRHTQAYVLEVCIVLRGVPQWMDQLVPLWRFGFIFEYNWTRIRSASQKVVRTMMPMVLGLAVTQVNAPVDVLLA